MTSLENTYKDYLIELDNSDINSINEMFIKRFDGVSDEEIFKKFTKYLNCKRTLNGYRITQTIHKCYHRDISMAIYMIDNIISEDSKDYCIKLLNDIHNENIRFEKDNPPVVYEKKKAKKVNTSKKSKTRKQTELFDDSCKTFAKKIFSNANMTIGI